MDILFFTLNHWIQAGAETYPHYGPGPGPGSWGAYDLQRAQGHR